MLPNVRIPHLRPIRPVIWVIPIVAFASAWLPGVALGQTGFARVHGLVVDERSGKPVATALVTLQEARVSAETTDRGRFTLPPVTAGTYSILVQRIGYEQRQDEIRLDFGSEVDITIRLSTKPVELEPIEVVTRSGKLAEVGYYDRRDNGGLSGRFITNADLIEHNATGLTDALVDVPGVKVFYLQPGRTTVRFNRHVTPRDIPGQRRQYALDPPRNALDLRGCEPDLYIDGQLYRNASPPMVTGATSTQFGHLLNRVDDFNAVSVAGIEGVEVYVGAAVPPFVYNTACGVILIWTRR